MLGVILKIVVGLVFAILAYSALFGVVLLFYKLNGVNPFVSDDNRVSPQNLDLFLKMKVLSVAELLKFRK